MRISCLGCLFGCPHGQTLCSSAYCGRTSVVSSCVFKDTSHSFLEGSPCQGIFYCKSLWWDLVILSDGWCQSVFGFLLNLGALHTVPLYRFPCPSHFIALERWALSICAQSQRQWLGIKKEKFHLLCCLGEQDILDSVCSYLCRACLFPVPSMTNIQTPPLPVSHDSRALPSSPVR